MDILLHFKNATSYEKLKTKIIYGNAPMLSALVYNVDDTQSIYQFNLNEYDYSCYGFPELYKDKVWLEADSYEVIGKCMHIGSLIEFNLQEGIMEAINRNELVEIQFGIV